MDAFEVGLLAGLGIALPLGAIGVLIIREGIHRGLRAAIPAALAVAVVDFGYALVAVVLGARVAATLAGWQRVTELVGAAALAVVVLVGLRATLRAGSAPDADHAAADPRLPTSRVVARFVALTAINPMTAVYFVALTTGLTEQLSGRGAGAAFALGVLVGSATWQLVLAVVGALAGVRMTHRLRIAVSALGYSIVAAYAVRLAVG